MSESTISHDTALNLKSAALALQESEQYLRNAGDTAEGVVEAAASEYLERRAAFQEAVKAAEKEYDGDPADADTSAEEAGTDVTEEVAEQPADRAEEEKSDAKADDEEPPVAPGDKGGSKSGGKKG